MEGDIKMLIDLREVNTIWINLDSYLDNCKKMQEQLEKNEFKNHHRFSALSLEYIQKFIKTDFYGDACGLSHVTILENPNIGVPLLVLEDDAKITENFNPLIDVPPETDAIYLGTSAGNPEIKTRSYNDQYLRIANMYSTHAILYLTENFKKAVADVTKRYIFKERKPCDIGVASIQEKFNVLAVRTPFFVQGNDRQSNAKNEKITSRQLQDLNSIF